MRLSAKSRALVVGVATAGLLVTYVITGGPDPSSPPETSPQPGVSSPTPPRTQPAPVPDDSPRERRDSTEAPAPPAQGEPSSPSAPVLAEPTPAAEALPQLTQEQLESSAASVGRTVREYRDLVTNDSTYWMDRSGATYVVDPLPEQAAATATGAGKAEEGEGEDDKPDVPAGHDSVDLSDVDVRKLHSNPDSKLKLFINVGGGPVPAGNGSNGGWRDIISAETYPAWTPKGTDPAARDALIYQIWKTVAADYAPFGIDVTTENPGKQGLRRTNGDDDAYGATIAVTNPPKNAFNDCGCVGLAYVDTFSKNADKVTDGHRLGFVFPRTLGTDVDGIAQSISHEAGHILGLTHDGILDAPFDDNYYEGHDHWNSIMGFIELDVIHTQWSKGDYPDANNQQDDVAVLTGQLGQRDDDVGDTREDAGTMVDGSASGIITSEDDVNVHHLGTCSGEVTIAATPTATRSNLDIELTLLDDAGAVLPPVNPANTVDKSDPTAWWMRGLDARIETTLDEGDYWVQVRGGSNRTWATGGYDAYGSTGAYELTSTCSGPSATQTTTELTVDGDAAAPTLTAVTTRTSDDEGEGEGDDPVTGSVIFRSSGTELATVPLVDGEAEHELADLITGTHLLSAEFIPAAGDGPTAVAPSRSELVEHEVPGDSHLSVEETEVDGNDAQLTLDVGPVADGTLDVRVDREELDGELDQTLEVEEPEVAVELTDLAPGLHWVHLTHNSPDNTARAVLALQIRVEGPDLRPEVTLDVDGSDGVRTLTATVDAAEQPASGHIEFYVDGTSVETVELVDGEAVLEAREFPDGIRMFGAEFIPADETLAPAFATDVTQDVIHPSTVSVQPSVVDNKIKLDVTVGPRDRGKLNVLVDGERHTVDVWRRKFSTRVGPFPAGKHTVKVSYDPEKGDTTAGPTFRVKVPKLAPKVKVKAPKQKRRGKRAKLAIKVRSKSTVSGKVRVRTKGWTKTVKLNRKGNVKVKTPKLRKGKKQRFVVRYLGNANTKAKRAKVVIKIRG